MGSPNIRGMGEDCSSGGAKKRLKRGRKIENLLGGRVFVGKTAEGTEGWDGKGKESTEGPLSTDLREGWDVMGRPFGLCKGKKKAAPGKNIS